MEKKNFNLEATDSELEGMQDDLSDFLCWVQGYDAGCRAGDVSGYPYDVEGLRRLNIQLKKHRFNKRG